jgi:hypothetical protein
MSRDIDPTRAGLETALSRTGSNEISSNEKRETTTYEPAQTKIVILREKNAIARGERGN